MGNVFFETIGEDTGVYAEPEILQDAAWEFGDTQAMLDAAEALYGPYQWGRYDLLILPPSFPLWRDGKSTPVLYHAQRYRG